MPLVVFPSQPERAPILSTLDGRRIYAEHAAQEIQAAVADFYIVLQRVETLSEALAIRRLLEHLYLSVGAAEYAAMDKVESL